MTHSSNVHNASFFLDHSNLSEQSGQSASLLQIFSFSSQQEDVFDADLFDGSQGNTHTAVLAL